MDVAHQLVRQGAPEGTCVWTTRQRQGRGRLGRTWESPEGGVYFSLILRPERPPEEIPQLSLVAGLSAAEAIRGITRLSPSIRWPNDLLLEERKVAGILIEAKDGAVVVGVGMNVTTQPTALPETATSLAACGAACDPYTLTAEVCRRFEGWYDSWRTEGFAPIREALRPWLSHLGEVVRVTLGTTHPVEGQVVDVDETGRLLLRLESGAIRPCEVGEVTFLR
jgi:BirA family biotin operon repressor/biotin-[acetyl-CoA-carboxylase] ligase